MEPESLKTGCFGRWTPTAPMAGTPRGAGISGKKKGPEIIRALQFGGGMVPGIKRLLKVRNRSAAGCCEPVRTGSKSLPVRPAAPDDQAGFSD
ncbi:hypothetical protein ABF86_12190 [Nitrosomonas sp. GH22]|nr:hypothetical protein [Nitrosomonas sp. GH22]